MNPRLRHRAEVLRHIFPNCVRDVDGYWVYFPTTGGAFTSADIRVIAELLEGANRQWDQEVRDYFEGRG